MSLATQELYGPDMEVAPEIFERYFSPWSAHAIEVDHVVYPTVEHAYHCKRYLHYPAVAEKIRTARSPQLAWELSRQYKDKQPVLFPTYKVATMHYLCKFKLDQHADVRQALVDSGYLEIVKHIVTGPPSDGFWDAGPDGAGQNKAGKIWMRLRKGIV